MRKNELRGSPVLEEARGREAALRAEWQAIAASIAAAPNSADFDAAWFTEQRFLESVTVVLAHAIYLPAARCFALLPFVSFMRRTGDGSGCDVDYDLGARSRLARSLRRPARGSSARAKTKVWLRTRQSA